MRGAKKLKFFNIGNTLSPYLKTLKEYRAFQYDHGTIDDLKTLVDKQAFIKNSENEKQVVIDNAEIAIVEDSCTVASAAPRSFNAACLLTTILCRRWARVFRKM